MIAPAGLALAGIILMASRRSATGDPRRRGMIFALLYGITINAGSTALGFSFWNLDALSLWAHHPGQHQSHSIIAVIIYTVAPLCAAVHVTACLFSARLLLFPRKKKLRPRNSCLT
ncbi:hypothetical protein [Amycolatopsis sp. PS_44_ISF1]|uniref:hypothetical protein n=1 Tax=Amycolatopsis sp. PS_44_ISF1 TaxID=2974917 RepID=UPI0028E069F9|nr:hypothetical protein [Amycolatopsis sp. PS_44_ISF1]MDT8913558.1 hypothetical protein [Amycolatopsis sp. PS_44_ISF1]